MATMERRFSFRHEGHLFFIYDHKKKKEEDDPKDAILYFYPRTVKTDDQIALVGGIIGITDFCLEFLPQEMPHIVKLSAHNFALIQHGDYIIGLAGSLDIPINFLREHMQFLWSTFTFYQGSMEALRQINPNSFLRELNIIWDIYLPLCQSQGDLLGQSFQAIPYIRLHRSQSALFLHASHILQRSLRHHGVLAGALFSKNKVLCTQVNNTLTRKLLLLMMQTQFPSVEVTSNLELPGGVHLIYVYLSRDEYRSLNHRRKKKYSSSSQQSLIEDDLPEKTTQSSDVETGVMKKSIFSDSAISSGGEQVTSHLPNISCDSPNISSSGSDRSSFGESGKICLGERCDPRKLAYSPKSLVLSGTDSEIFMDSVSEFQNEVQDISKSVEVRSVCEKSSDSTVLKLESRASSDPSVGYEMLKNVRNEGHFQKLTKENSFDESQQTGINCNGEVVDESIKGQSWSSEYNSSVESPQQEQLSSSVSDKSSHSLNGVTDGPTADTEHKLCDRNNFIPESQHFQGRSSQEHQCLLEKEICPPSEFIILNSKKPDELLVLSNSVENNLKDIESSRRCVKNSQSSNDITESGHRTNLKLSTSLSLNDKELKSHISASVSNDVCYDLDKPRETNSSENCLRRPVSLEDTFMKRILNSGDESSLHSSCEVRKGDYEERSRESSVVSLENSDVTSSKDRLTFENLDSENSDCEIVSPDPEIGRLSPEGEESPIPVDLTSLRTADGAEVSSSLKSFHGLEDEVCLAKRLSELKSFEEENSVWLPHHDNLEQMQLYIQGHSDTLLVLLIKKDVNYSKSSVHSLWKSCLSHLAELDFEVKNVERHTRDESEKLGAHYQFMKYDSFSHNLSGSVMMPITSLANQMVDSCVLMHKDFLYLPDLIEATYRSHTACSMGKRSVNNETYYQIGLPSRGGVNPGERTFHLEKEAETVLAKEQKINLF